MPITRWVGPEGGAVVVFVHGSPGDQRGWTSVLSHVPAGIRCALVNLPDHGDPRDDASLDPRRLELDVEAVVRAIDRPVTLVGHGLGAWACARVLAALGTQVERAVLVSGFPAIPTDVSERLLAFALALESGELPVEEARAFLLREWLGTHGGESALAIPTRSLLDLPVRRLVRAARRQAAATAPVTAFPTTTTVLHATGDVAIPLAQGEALAELGDHALLITMETDAHHLPIAEAKEIAELVFQRADP